MVLMLYIALSRVCSGEFVKYVRITGLALMIVGVVLSVVSCVNYSVNAVKALSKNDKDTEESPVEEDE